MSPYRSKDDRRRYQREYVRLKRSGGKAKAGIDSRDRQQAGIDSRDRPHTQDQQISTATTDRAREADVSIPSTPDLTREERAIIRKLNRLDPDRLGYRRPLADNPKPPSAVPTYPALLYTADELAAMDPQERSAAERLAAPDYDALAQGDCVSCHTGPRLIDGLCLDCADPAPIVAKPSDTNH